MTTPAQGVMWDNDTFAIPKDTAYKAKVMGIVYGGMKAKGVTADSDEAKEVSKDFAQSYADWLAE